MKSHARVVVIGGGVVGCSVLDHLTKLGWSDVVLLERDKLTAGSTWHAAGLVGQLRSDPALTRMNVHSAQLYRDLDVGWAAPGSPPGGRRWRPSVGCSPP